MQRFENNNDKVAAIISPEISTSSSRDEMILQHPIVSLRVLVEFWSMNKRIGGREHLGVRKEKGEVYGVDVIRSFQFLQLFHTT